MSFASLKVHGSAVDGMARGLWRQVGRQLTEFANGAGERALAQRNAVLAFTVRVASAAILFLSQVAIARWIRRKSARDCRARGSSASSSSSSSGSTRLGRLKALGMALVDPLTPLAARRRDN